MTVEIPKTTIIGASGFVAGGVIKHSPDKLKVLHTPSHNQLDISDPKFIERYLLKNPSKAVINFAAYTNVKEAKAQAFNKKAEAWRVNVLGAKNVAEVCKKLGIFLVHISTDNVFLGSHGPLKEDDRPSVTAKLDWYSYTKRVGEEKVGKAGGEFAIVRIAYPFGNPIFEKDYILKLITTIKSGYPIFDDHRLTPTYIPSLAEPLWLIVSRRKSGKFHVVCQGVTTPCDIAVYLKEIVNFPEVVKRGSLKEYEKQRGKSTYNMYGDLDATRTQKELGVTLPKWQEAVGDYVSFLKAKKLL